MNQSETDSSSSMSSSLSFTNRCHMQRLKSSHVKSLWSSVCGDFRGLLVFGKKMALRSLGSVFKLSSLLAVFLLTNHEADSINSTVDNHLQKALRFVQAVQNQTKCDKVVYLDVLLDHHRWKREALLVLEVANLMTSLWQSKGPYNRSIAEDDSFLYHSVRSIIMFSPPSFGSVICFDRNQYKDYYLFCPYAYKPLDKNNAIKVFDIASQDGGYDYSEDENAIWWSDTKKKALTLSPANQTEIYAVRLNATAHDQERAYTVPVVRYSDGIWTRPYYDCFGGKIWMVTYLAPFFNDTGQFLGVVSIDIQLMHIDINQCDAGHSHENEEPRVDQVSGNGDADRLVEFLGTHRCKRITTKCVHIPHQGFVRGSYRCECKKGYYFPDVSSKERYFKGVDVESGYDDFLEGTDDQYETGFECLKCSEGCQECVNANPCTYNKNIVLRVFLAVVNGVVLLMTIGFGVTVCYYRKYKVIKASSPRFLLITILGVITMYIKPFVNLSDPTNILCIVEQWLRHLGFVIANGSIIIKTWRVAVIFRVRSAQRMALTDSVLLRRLLIILMGYVIYMLLWTNINPPRVSEWKTTDGLLFDRCVLNEWLEVIAIVGDLGLLSWGMLMCYRVRNAPSAYNESKFVSWAIYNSMFVTCFSTVLRFTIRNSTNPDVMSVLEFVFVHTTATTTILLILVHKFVHIRKIKQVTNEAISIHNASGQNGGERVHMTDDNDQPINVECEELRGEIERLTSQVASLQTKLLQEKNKEVSSTAQRRQSRLKYLGFGPAAGQTNTTATTSTTRNKDQPGKGPSVICAS